MLVILPVTFTIFNIIGLFHEYDEDLRNDMWCYTLAVGFIDSFLYLIFHSYTLTFSEWCEPLAKGELHETIGATWDYAILGFFIIGLIALLVMMRNDVNYLPPLVTVMCFSAMYLMAIILVVWCIQISNNSIMYPIIVLFANILMMVIILTRDKIREWCSEKKRNPKYMNFGKNPIIKSLNEKLQDAKKWHVYAIDGTALFLVMLFIILILVGQGPLALIEPWTETTDWTLSQKTRPQDIQHVDEYGYYLEN